MDAKRSGAPRSPRARQCRARAAAPPRRSSAGSGVHVGDDDDQLHARQLRGHFRHGGEGVERLAGVEIAVGGEEHLGRDLPEAVEHAVHAEVRRAGGPGRAEAGGRQHGDGGLRQVGQEARDPVALADSRGAQASRDARHFAPQLPMGDLPARAALVDEHDGGVIVVVPQQVLGEVEPGVREEARAGHELRILEHRARRPSRRGRRRSARAPSRIPPGAPRTRRTGPRSPPSRSPWRAFRQAVNRVRLESATRAAEGRQISVMTLRYRDW